MGCRANGYVCKNYDKLKRIEGDNFTVSIILCSETDEDIAGHSVLKMPKNMKMFNKIFKELYDEFIDKYIRFKP